MDNSFWLSARKYDVIKELERRLVLHFRGDLGGANWALHIGCQSRINSSLVKKTAVTSKIPLSGATGWVGREGRTITGQERQKPIGQFCSYEALNPVVPLIYWLKNEP